MKTPSSCGSFIRAYDIWGIAVARLRLGFLAMFFSCAFGFASFAQDSQSAATAGQPTGASSKAHVKKKQHKKESSAGLTLAPSSEESEKAARLAEGRKKFFEQSSGFDNSGKDTPMSLGGGKGFTPEVGFKF